MSPIRALLIVSLGVLVFFSSCRKEEDTIALIKVINLNGENVESALVTLSAEATNNSGENVGETIDDVETFTDAAGEALFDFTDQYEEGQAGFAVLNVNVIKDTLAAEGIIKIDPEMVNEETLILQ